jgi:hypothetical protein
MEDYWFKSSLFNIVPDEDEAANPQCYGKELSAWLGTKLSNLGYTVEVVPEDWGWCVMCSRKPYSLWVGCGCMVDDKNALNKESIVWHCFVVADVPFAKRIFGKVNTRSGISSRTN